MSKRSPMTTESYPGGTTHRFRPDTYKPTNATLDHVNRLSANINTKPTFEKAVQHMVAEYGPVSALVMLMPVAFGAVADFDHIGAEVGRDVSFQTMVHAIHATNVGSGDHVGAEALLSEPANMLDRLITDKNLVKDGENTYFHIDNQPQIDNSISNNVPERGVDFDQYTFDDGTQFYHTGDAGFFMVYNPSPEIGSSRLSFGNQIPSELKGQLNGELALFDVSSSALNASPIQDGSGISGFEVYRGGVSPDSLKLLLANHSHRRGSATKRAIELAASNGGGAINLKIRVEDSTSVDGQSEKIVKFYALGSDSTTLLATKEIRSGGIQLPAGTPKNAMLSRTTNLGEQVLVVTPTFPENTPAGYVVWSDETGAVFAGEGYGDKKLILENHNEGSWVEVESAETVTMSGVILAQDSNGVLTITKVTGADAKTQAENRMKVDPTAWGFKEDEAEIRKIDGKLFITPAGEPDTHIAEWVGGYAGEWLWQWDELEKLPGGNPIFKTAKLWEMDGSNEVDREGAEKDSAMIEDFASNDKSSVPGEGLTVNQAGYLVSQDGKEVIGTVLKSKTKVSTPEIAASGEVDGRIFYLDRDGKTVREAWIEGLISQIRYWRVRH